LESELLDDPFKSGNSRGRRRRRRRKRKSTILIQDYNSSML
jgi:hypothetical protein